VLSCDTFEKFLKLIRGHIVAVTMDADGVVKSLDVFKDQPVRMLIIQDFETIQPFTLDQRVKGFNTGVVIRIAFVTVTELKLLCGFSIRFRNILTSAIRVKDQRLIGIPTGFCLENSIDYTGSFQGF
jgi:hypothetical protein